MDLGTTTVRPRARVPLSIRAGPALPAGLCAAWLGREPLRRAVVHVRSPRSGSLEMVPRGSQGRRADGWLLDQLREDGRPEWPGAASLADVRYGSCHAFQGWRRRSRTTRRGQAASARWGLRKAAWPAAHADAMTSAHRLRTISR